MNNDFFIEIDYRLFHELGSVISSDVCLNKRGEDRSVMVLSDGAGRGIQTNVIASMIASMALNYTLTADNLLRATRRIIETFAVNDKFTNTNHPSFTIVSIDNDNKVKIAEFGNPDLIIIRDGKELKINKKRYSLNHNKRRLNVVISEYNALCEDRILAFTDGITKSGYATYRLPTGWGRSGVIKLVTNTLKQTPYISGVELAQTVVNNAEMNDLFVVRNDMCCSSIYLRKPRKVLVCTGPPFKEQDDKVMANIVNDYDGNVIVSGGTTSQIISRELGREQTIIMKRDSSGLPPISKIDGLSMVTEGVLTLNKVKHLLESIKNTNIKGTGIDANFARMLLEHDVVDFLVGNKINASHQDPRLPVELELRRNVVKDLARILEFKFMKQINITFI